MKKSRLVWLLLTLGFSVPLLAADSFVVCQSTYALCTTAKCAPYPAKRAPSRVHAK